MWVVLKNRIFSFETLLQRSHDSNLIPLTFPQFSHYSRSISNSSNSPSPTITYLTNSCGLSLESAFSASKSITINNPQNSDSVLDLLKVHGFTKPQITTLISRNPHLLLASPHKTLEPKIQFFKSLGILGPGLSRLLCADAFLLHRSLKKNIIPKCDLIKGFVQNNENLVSAIKQWPLIFNSDILKMMGPNMESLRAHGVPESNIGKLLMIQHGGLVMRNDLFEDVINAIKEMGFDPRNRSFILAVRVIASLSKLKWEMKKELLLSLGWSESEFASAFKVQPILMSCSAKKIGELMDFFVNKVGLRPSQIAKCPNILLTSLERRIIPRCSVLQVLMSRALISKDINTVVVFNMNKLGFEKRFVIKYEEKVPELIKAYKGDIVFQGFK